MIPPALGTAGFLRLPPHRLSTLLALSILLLPALPSTAQSLPSTADTLYLHGHILTGAGLGTGHAAAHPVYASAIAIAQGKVLAVGGDDELTARYQGPATTLIDLHGAFAMPGFNDAHVHLASAGHIKLSVDQTSCRTLAEMQARIARAAAAAAPGAWLTGGGWDHTLWPGRTLPTRADLDAVTADHPALFQRVDGHIAIANSAALAAAGIGPRTPDPPGGHIDRDATGQATGIVRESPALALIETHIPPPSAEDRRRGLELALADAAAHGITSVQDFSTWEDFLVLESLEREGRLPVRVTEWLPFDAPLPILKKWRAAHPADDPMLHTGMLKGFLDGSLGSRTAAMLAPYADDPGNSGLPRYQQATLNSMAAERAAAGFQLGFHAIGDRAVQMALNAFQVAEAARTQAHVPGQPRFRIEHSQVLAASDFARYLQLAVIASMQPSHLLTDMHWAPARLGPAREQYAYAWKSFLDAGVPLPFGTDYPIEPITPMRGLYAAVTRSDEAATMRFHPEQVLSMEQALYAYTQASAYAEFAESWKGRLAAGFAADFVVLDRDLLEAQPAAILTTRVLQTIVAGRVVYRAPEHAPPAAP
ncbi:MAG TPA: amidohydrolase [Acidobacteriaceae bacterium]